MKRIIICIFFACLIGIAFGDCPSMDSTGDCRVDFEDYAIFASQWLGEGYDDLGIFASQWLIEGTPGKEIAWVEINDLGVGDGRECFTGYMSKYEITNHQYCQFLNEALVSGDVFVDGSYVRGDYGSNSGEDFYEQGYYNLVGGGFTYNGATGGGASRINYTGSEFTVDSGFEDHPVTYVSWYGAVAFCNYYGYRLPTEWQWQAVADYDGSYNWGCGPVINTSVANIYNSTHPDGTAEVGSFGDPNGYGYGICDLTGNVWEWTDSWYTDDQNYHVLKGASWDNSSYYCPVSYRHYKTPTGVSSDVGFRVWRTFEVNGIVWVDVNDPGVDGHEGFNGQMSKYETTNSQFCQFLNEALASGDITVGADNIVYGADGDNDGADFVDEPYFKTTPGAPVYSQITYSEGIFSVRTRNGYDMSNHPVLNVSWYGATAFCNYYGYRLPTEWEWQAVADYDGSYTYGCGTTIDQSKANFFLDSASFANPLGLLFLPYTTPVDYYPSYGYYMNDMAGGVREWTSTVNLDDTAVYRGGGWVNHQDDCTVSKQESRTLEDAIADIGFRVCR